MATKPRIHQIIVVEGRDDTRRLKEFFDVDTIETNGSAISDETLEYIRFAQDQRGVIVFTDPDISGTKIRHIIEKAVPNVQHAFIERQAARPKRRGSLGVEHASKEVLEEALAHVYQIDESVEPSSKITIADLTRLGLIGEGQAKKKREFLGEVLHIGYTNGKQLKRRLERFQIKLSTVEELLQQREEEMKHGA